VRILFASEYYPPFAPGGGEWTIAAWAAALARRGHEVTVVTPNYGPAPLPESPPGVTVVRVPFPISVPPGAQREARWFVHRNPFFYLYFAWQVARAARRARADLIHAQNKGALVPAWLAARALGHPVVFTVRDAGLICPLAACTFFESTWNTFDCSFAQYINKCVPFFQHEYVRSRGVLHGMRLWTSLRLSWLDNRFRQAALKRVDGVIGVSRGILEIHPQRLVDGGRDRVVYSPPPTVREPSAEAAAAERKALEIGDAPLVLYAGKLSLGKGTTVLVNSFAAIRRAVPSVRFVFAGKGDGFRLPIADDVQALGSIPQLRLFALYRAADVVVVPSVWPEPLSRVLIEAMRFGRAVVATDVGGTREIVDDGVTGLLVPKKNADALANAITSLLLDPERRARMGAAAVKRAARFFDEDQLVADLLAAYAAAAKRATA
jgi:glycosyltransferase involved in cell wall biosynthesis